jgi:hypothetical protein
MRKSTFLSAFAVLLVVHSFDVHAQDCNFKGIRTDPANPLNTELSIKTNTFFNWMNPDWPGNTTCYPGPGVNFTSPFYRIDNLEALRLLKDYKPDDGWELIRRDFGYRDDGTLITDRPEHTYLILYNKYTGILRVILRTCRKEDYTGAQITIRFHNPTFQTALLDLNNNAQALDAPHEVNPEFVAATTFYNDDSKYFYADYPLAYDPCTCKNQSRLNVLSNLIENATITLGGPITGNIVSITNKNGSVSNNDGSLSWKKIVGGTEKLVSAYKTIDAFKTATSAYATALGKSPMATELNNLAGTLKGTSAFSTGLNAIPWVGAAVSMLDFFVSGGKKSTTTAPVELMPLSVNLNAQLSGTMQTSVPYHSISFPTPGSLNAQNDVDAYPYYNEVLGIFNLLSTPTIQTRVNIENYYGDDGFRYRLTYIYLRLKRSEIKYVLNPAAEVTIQDMKVSILAEGRGDASGPGGSFDRYEGKDAKTGNDVWGTEYMDASCIETYVHELNFGDEAIMNHWDPANIYHLKFILNLKRNNATSTTQNVLYVIKFPMKWQSISNINYSPAPTNGINCNLSPIAAQTTTQINELCSSAPYLTNRFQARVRPSDPATEKVDNNFQISVSPNPASSHLTVKITGEQASLQKIELINAMGQSTKGLLNEKVQLPASGFTRTFYVGDVAAGIYFVKIQTSKGVETRKVLISRK